MVERAIGLLKGQWRCLDRLGGTVLYSPTKVCRIAMACAVLHNIAQRHDLPVPLNPSDYSNLDPGPSNAVPNARAIHLRLNIINGM